MNLTLINLVLRLRPMTEPALAATLLVLRRRCAALWRCFCGSAGRGGIRQIGAAMAHPGPLTPSAARLAPSALGAMCGVVTQGSRS